VGDALRKGVLGQCISTANSSPRSLSEQYSSRFHSSTCRLCPNWGYLLRHRVTGRDKRARRVYSIDLPLRRDPAHHELVDFLRSRPLVTLAGPAGCGKTRLATEIGRRCSVFPDGVWFVDMAVTTAGPGCRHRELNRRTPDAG
jgi:hypothetical protein